MIRLWQPEEFLLALNFSVIRYSGTQFAAPVSFASTAFSGMSLSFQPDWEMSTSSNSSHNSAEQENPV